MEKDVIVGHSPAPYEAEAEHLPSTEFREAVPEWDSEEVHLRDYLEVVVRRKWLIINTLLLTFVTVLILTLSQHKLYRSSATIEVAPQDEKVTKFQEVVSSDIDAQAFFETQVELLKSRELVRRVADRLELMDNPVIEKEVFGDGHPGLFSGLKSMARELVLSMIPKDRRARPKGAAVSEEVLHREKVLDYVGANMDVAPSRRALLIDVSFISPDRDLSRAVANGLADQFVQWNMEKKMEASDLARTFLMKQIDRAKINLEKAEEALNQFAQQAGIVSLDSKQNSVYRQLEDLNEALAAAEADLISRKAVYDQARKDGPSVLPDVMQSTMINDLKTQYASLQGEYEKLKVDFQDDYPSVRALLERKKSIAERITEEENRIFAMVRSSYEAAAEKKANLEKRLAEQKQLAMDLNKRTTQYKIMAREVETNKQIYQSLLERSREIESMAGISSSNIHIVDRAELPILPAKPNVRRNLLLAVVLGLFAGVALAFFLEYFTDHIANPDEISDRFRIPILGILPLVKREAAGDLDKALEMDSRTPFCEAVRTTCVSLKLSGAGSKSKSFVITSTRPSEGKTTLAANLALSFALAGEKVVLVDADMRRPRIHKVFHPGTDGNGNGLSSFLAGSADRHLIRTNGQPNLHIIPAGPIPPNPVELLASPRFNRLIKALEKRYDRVIVDGPPISGCADTLVLSRNVGGVVLLSSVGQTTREALRHFKKSILNVNSTILGCIINKVDLSKRYGYRSYYGYYGYYGYNENDQRVRTLPG